MDTTGKLISVTRDFVTGKLNVTFQIDTEPIDDINSLSLLDKICIVAKRFAKKRSLDANAYAWVLMTKIANHPDVKSSKEEVYEEMLQKYGYLDKDEDGYIVITLKSSIDVRRIGGHWKFYQSNGKFNSYLSIKGSSEYSSSEMHHFVNQIVDECKGLGIETIPPAELERMVSRWRSD